MTATLVRTEIDLPCTHRAHRRAKRETPLAYTLRVIGKPPIDPACVRRWMNRKIEELTPINNWYRDHSARTKASPVRAIMFLAFLLLSTAAVRHWVSGSRITPEVFGLEIFAVFIYMISRHCERRDFEIFLLREQNLRVGAEWRTVSPKRYLELARDGDVPPIPDEVKLTMDEISARLPEAKHELVYFKADPFLKTTYVNPATDKKEQHFVMAWDEHGFVF